MAIVFRIPGDAAVIEVAEVGPTLAGVGFLPLRVVKIRSGPTALDSHVFQVELETPTVGPSAVPLPEPAR